VAQRPKENVMEFDGESIAMRGGKDFRPVRALISPAWAMAQALKANG
jgi:hypothetical protein